MWVITIVFLLGVVPTGWIIYKEKQKFIQTKKQSVIKINQFYSTLFEKEINTKEQVGLKTRELIQNALNTHITNTRQTHLIKNKNGEYRSSDGYSGAFLSSNAELTKEVESLFVKTEEIWKNVAPLVTESFFNLYMITKDSFIRIYPKDWALEIESDHDFSNDIFYKNATPEYNPDRKPVWTPVYYDSIWKKWMTSLIIPMYGENDKFLGIIGADYILDDIVKYIENLGQYENNINGYIFDNEGNLISFSRKDNENLDKNTSMNTLLDKKIFENAGLEKLIQRTVSKEVPTETIHEYIEKSEKYFAYIKPIKQGSWYLCVGTSEGEILKELNDFIFKVIIVFLILVCLLSVIIFLSIRNIVLSRIDNLGTTVQKISSGNLNNTLNKKRADEIGLLESGVINMQAAIKDKINDLQNVISERDNAITDLKYEKAMTARLYEKAPYIVCGISPDGITRYINPFGEKITGYTSEDIVGSNWWDIFYPGKLRIQVEQLFEAFETGDVSEYEMTLTTKNGHHRTVLWNSINTTNAKGELEEIIGFGNDITKRKHAEQEQEKLKKQLFQSQKLEGIGQLAGGIAHDFNNILTALMGFTDLALLETEGNRNAQNAIHEIQQANERATDLVRQLLAFSRKQVYSPKVLNVNYIIVKLYQMLSRMITEDIEIKLELDEHINNISADPSQIEQIIINMSVNARDAILKKDMATKDKLISIKTSDIEVGSEMIGTDKLINPGHYVLISISDNGIGMDKDVMANIFEPFYTTKEVHKGTGLGLSTVYGIVKQNKGHITVYSEPGEGAVFKIYWPAVFEKSEETEESEKKEPKSGKLETILLAEDNEIVRKVAVDVLTHANYRVIAVEDGIDALEKAREINFNFDLLITDVTMPRMTGNELAAEILKVKPDMKILYATGYNENIFNKDGKMDTEFPIIHKPFRPGEFIEKVSELLHND